MGIKLANRTKRSVRAVSPALSAVIITGMIVTLLCVVLVFANSFLWTRLAEGEFNAAKQFMQAVGLQIDDVAWIAGRTATVRYSSKYGDVYFMSSALKYTVYIKKVGSSNYQMLYSNTTGILLFNMPTSKYSVSNGYFEGIYPSDSSPVLEGASAPLARIFAVEKVPMNDGSYVRVVVAPSLRLVNSTITSGTGQSFYTKLYFPRLTLKEAPRHSQSITISGESVFAITNSSITQIKVVVEFPLAGFDNSFFNFSQTEEEFTVPSGSTIQIYIGEVEVSLGRHL
jgi:hypothetical protein